jgi:hypothetical protein
MFRPDLAIFRCLSELPLLGSHLSRRPIAHLWSARFPVLQLSSCFVAANERCQRALSVSRGRGSLNWPLGYSWGIRSDVQSIAARVWTFVVWRRTRLTRKLYKSRFRCLTIPMICGDTSRKGITDKWQRWINCRSCCVLTAVVENVMSMFGYVMCGTQPQQLHLVKVCAAACNFGIAPIHGVMMLM